MSLAIGLDIGGTKIIGGVVDEAGQVLARSRRPTPGGGAVEAADAIAEVVRELRGSFPEVTAVGIGAAGWIASDRATVVFAPHLAWRGEAVRDELVARLGLPVTLDNDANAAAWAEHRFGAGRGVDDLVMITVGTGIGGGFVLAGRLYRGAFGIAGEPGHAQVVPGGRPCECGNSGCWEQYASGRALIFESRAAASTGFGEPIIDGVTGPAVTSSALRGEAAALAAFEAVGYWLGVGMANLAAVLDPGMFVLGGGVSDAGPLLLGPARRAFAGSLSGRGHRPLAAIELAELGPEAGLVGAADLARKN